MRKLVLALAIGMLVASSAVTAAPGKAMAASAGVKVVIVVGATQGATAAYRADAESAAAEFAKFSTADRPVNVTKVYSPSATWSAVSAAARGANILLYLGHGSGYPNPYLSYEQPNGDNGMGLNTPTGGSDNVTQYYGENYMAQLGLAPNAVVLLNHLCYASGNNEGGAGNPSLAVAETHVDGYASGFIRGGAKAVLAEGMNDIEYYIDGLFTSHTTIDAMWKANPWFHNHVTAWWATRPLPGYVSQIDPDLDHPASDGEVYYRSMVAIATLLTDDVISSPVLPWTAQTGTYYPIAPFRVVDTRGYGTGPIGTLSSGGPYTFAVVGSSPVPKGAIAITGNLTVTDQTALGWVYVGPQISSAPGPSTINFLRGDNRANGITVPLSPQGTLDAWYGAVPGASTDIVIDVTGYFMPNTDGDGYVQYGPHRILDTRVGNGLTGKFYSSQPRAIRVAGVAGLPDKGIVAVAGNVTVVSPTYLGYVYISPTAAVPPTSSTINFPANDIRANNFVVPIGPDGSISAAYWTSVPASVELIIDISGYYTAGGGAQYHTLNPARILDSRVPVGLTGPIPAGQAQTLQITGAGGVDAGAVALNANLTVTQQTYLGWVGAGPAISLDTIFSNVNFPVNDNRANGVTVPLTTDGKLQLMYGAPAGQNIQLVLDVCGYFK